MFEVEDPRQEFGEVTYWLSDSSRAVHFTTTLSSDDIKAHVEAFRFALKAFGFQDSSIDAYVAPLEE